ncbi:hypothetical protein [Pendulispora albinea]|uniref:Lipoprotein n=1 Tax=Pendulispora albinea TaxID=2741071 RepID=A0ABZ2LYP6_9BACT
MTRLLLPIMKIPPRWILLLSSTGMMCCGGSSSSQRIVQANDARTSAPTGPSIEWFQERSEVYCRPDSSRLELPKAFSWELGAQDASSLQLISRDRSSAVLPPLAVIIVRTSSRAEAKDVVEAARDSLRWLSPTFEDDWRTLSPNGNIPVRIAINDDSLLAESTLRPRDAPPSPLYRFVYRGLFPSRRCRLAALVRLPVQSVSSNAPDDPVTLAIARATGMRRHLEEGTELASRQQSTMDAVNLMLKAVSPLIVPFIEFAGSQAKALRR